MRKKVRVAAQLVDVKAILLPISQTAADKRLQRKRQTQTMVSTSGRPIYCQGRYLAFFKYVEYGQHSANTFTLSHLADAFIQSDLQMRTMEAIKTNKRAMIFRCYDKAQLA